MASNNHTPNSTNTPSDFYMACRQGSLVNVNRFLKTMPTREINKIEIANNSTALHAASFYGHVDVVKRLLEVGANVHTRNGHGLTAQEEAKTQEIKDLFKNYQ